MRRSLADHAHLSKVRTLAPMVIASLLLGCSGAEEPAAAPPPARTAATDPAASPPPVEAEVAPEPAIDPCALVRARTASVLDPVDAQVVSLRAAHPELDELGSEWAALSAPLRECWPSTHGAWFTMPEAPEVSVVEGESMMGERETGFRLDLRAVLTYVDDAGGFHPARGSCAVLAHPLDFERARLEKVFSFDYDGDGIEEIMLRCGSSVWEDSGARLGLWTFREGTVAAYSPASGIDLADTADQDGDGRPDLISFERYWLSEECGDAPPPVGTPAVLFHSLPDGTFSAHDEVAGAFLRVACPEPPGALLLEENDCAAFHTRGRIACARLWGASAEEVRTRLNDEREHLSADSRYFIDSAWDGLDAYVTIEPPLRLR